MCVITQVSAYIYTTNIISVVVVVVVLWNTVIFTDFNSLTNVFNTIPVSFRIAIRKIDDDVLFGGPVNHRISFGTHKTSVQTLKTFPSHPCRWRRDKPWSTTPSFRSPTSVDLWASNAPTVNYDQQRTLESPSTVDLVYICQRGTPNPRECCTTDPRFPLTRFSSDPSSV